MQTRFGFAVLVCFGIASALGAQQPVERSLTLEDYGAWSRISGTTLSPDGGWLAWVRAPNEGDATLLVRQLDGTTVHEGVNATDVAFSRDSRWVAFLSSPPEEEAKALRDEGRPVHSTLHLIDLTSGTRSREPSVRAFTFAEDGPYLAIHKARADDEADHRGSDLLLRDLQGGTLLAFGNVSEYGFDEASDHLAYLVDAADESGNGLYVVALAEGRIRPVDTGPNRYEDLAWSREGPSLSALRGSVPDGMTERENVLVVAAAESGSDVLIYDPRQDPGFPEDFVISELADTRWTEDGERVVLGIKAQEPDPESSEESEDAADVDVWHWQDDRLQSTQKVQADGDRRFTYTSVFNVEANRFVRLATDDMRRVDLTDGDWAVGLRDVAYRGDRTRPQGTADYVRIDLSDGETAEIAAEVRRPIGASPDGAWWLYLADEHVQAVKLATLERTDLTEETGIDFVDREFDRIDEAPVHGLGGWTEDGRVLLYDRWDVWSVPLEGGSATAVTGGVGAADEIRYRVVGLDPEADYIDPEGALLSAYGEWTKQSGYMRARPGGSPEPLLFGDEMIGGVQKAEDAELLLFTRQTFQQFPDYWVSDLSFDDPRQVTEANPQIDEFAWGRRVLVDYTDERGNELQATLTLPAGYEEGRRYPMIVYFYEKMSQRHHEFSLPVYDDRPHMSTYASNGYLVLMPDIVYDDGYPGSSALDDVTAAARRVVELGYADPERIGLQGHSWGGYETSFILTQTDMFATIVTGAPLTNLMSMNNILYKRTGNGNGPILQWSQGRMGDQPWDDLERWISQSPVHHAPNISTPFLILHGTEDGAVDWNQGLELYTAARRLGKEVILLSYPGEPHHLQKEANQKDFQRRMKAYFDHHLQGAPAPAWMTDGVPYLEKGEEARKATIS
ncbi:MAG: prolyl oligopeptidase family serine peptidase [Gemmatimonadota bacterium]